MNRRRAGTPRDSGGFRTQQLCLVRPLAAGRCVRALRDGRGPGTTSPQPGALCLGLTFKATFTPFGDISRYEDHCPSALVAKMRLRSPAPVTPDPAQFTPSAPPTQAGPFPSEPQPRSAAQALSRASPKRRALGPRVRTPLAGPRPGSTVQPSVVPRHQHCRSDPRLWCMEDSPNGA